MGIARQGGQLALSSRRLFGSGMYRTCGTNRRPWNRAIQQAPRHTGFDICENREVGID